MCNYGTSFLKFIIDNLLLIIIIDTIKFYFLYSMNLLQYKIIMKITILIHI